MDFFILLRSKRGSINQSFFRNRAYQRAQEEAARIKHFFQKRYALSLSLGFIIGTISFHFRWAFLLYLFFFIRPRVMLPAIFLGFLYTYFFSPCSFIKRDGEGIFIPEKVQPFKSMTSGGYIVTGSLRSFISEEKTYHHLPATLFLKQKSPSLFSPIKFYGTVTQINGSYRIDIADYQNISLSNFALFRFDWKTQFQSYLKKRIPDRESAHFLSALVTGYLTNIYLKFSFYKLGLSHILAISGFHFSLLISLLSYCVAFLPIRPKAIALLIFSTCYFFLMGHSPSVTRAFVMIFIYYLATLYDLPSCPINNLGIASLILLLNEPSVIYSLSYQLSFLSCLGIFLYYPSLAAFFPIKKGFWLKIYTFYMHSMCLSIGVNVMICPILFAYFHKISLLGLVYNLFFPLQVTVCFASLLIFLPLDILMPCIGQYLLRFTGYITQLSLIPVLNPPMHLDFSLYADWGVNISILLTIISICLGVWLASKNEEAQIAFV